MVLELPAPQGTTTGSCSTSKTTFLFCTFSESFSLSLNYGGPLYRTAAAAAAADLYTLKGVMGGGLGGTLDLSSSSKVDWY